jgi:hypothetical protein
MEAAESERRQYQAIRQTDDSNEADSFYDSYEAFLRATTEADQDEGDERNNANEERENIETQDATDIVLARRRDVELSEAHVFDPSDAFYDSSRPSSFLATTDAEHGVVDERGNENVDQDNVDISHEIDTGVNDDVDYGDMDMELLEACLADDSSTAAEVEASLADDSNTAGELDNIDNED